MIKNDLLLRALKGESVSRPPVWIMRQAGRHLPEYIKLKEKYDFFTRVQTPELASEITIQPILRYGLDAAILFCDILVIPQAMGLEVQLREGVGPVLPKPVRKATDIQKRNSQEIQSDLHYVFEAIRQTKEQLNNEIPLIGFGGSPWTLLCYMIEGKGSKNFYITKEFCFQHPEIAHQVLQKTTETTIDYLLAKVKAGADAIQLFDSWGGLLSPRDYDEFSWKYIKQIVDAISEKVPVIVFAKGCWFALHEMAKSNVSALGIDWTITPQSARHLTNHSKTLQGNLDPCYLLSPISKIKKTTTQMIDEFGKDQLIVNLGHGILPNIPIDHAKAFVDTVKEYTPSSMKSKIRELL